MEIRKINAVVYHVSEIDGCYCKRILKTDEELSLNAAFLNICAKFLDDTARRSCVFDYSSNLFDDTTLSSRFHSFLA
jgi:hypothetical protein